MRSERGSSVVAANLEVNLPVGRRAEVCCRHVKHLCEDASHCFVKHVNEPIVGLQWDSTKSSQHGTVEWVDRIFGEGVMAESSWPNQPGVILSAALRCDC